MLLSQHVPVHSTAVRPGCSTDKLNILDFDSAPAHALCKEAEGMRLVQPGEETLFRAGV